MSCWQVLFLSFTIFLSTVNSAIIQEDGDVEDQGLYSKSDHVVILTGKNFERKIYGQRPAYLVQFYNSYCGHCRAFAPKFKGLAAEIEPWQNIFKLAVIDCFSDENNEVCRNFEVMAYPTLRYFHENYVKANGNVGDDIRIVDTAEKLKRQLINKMWKEQLEGRLTIAPSFAISPYTTFAQALHGVPNDVIYTFLIFENENSTLGSELILDFNTYPHINVRRVLDVSDLAKLANVQQFPGLIAVNPALEPLPLTPRNPMKQNFVDAIKSFLHMKNYVFPKHETENREIGRTSLFTTQPSLNADVVYYSDLELTLKATLHTEISRFKSLNAESHNALLEYLEVLRDNFPFQGNKRLWNFLSELHSTLQSRVSWTGDNIFNLVKNLEAKHNPYRTTESEYIGCKGSQAKYRGYTCGLWTLFHSLTVSATNNYHPEGPKILRAMLGFVKYFFGCTECSEHFQAMAARNKLFDVKDNDKAVLWLWISHNEVNLRLAGDITEDPLHPKIQFPSVSRCPECRLERGAWNLPVVYQYLLHMYGSEHIQDAGTARSAVTAPSPLSNLDIGMLSFLYILSFFILILVIKFFLTKRFYRKRVYKHGWGKV